MKSLTQARVLRINEKTYYWLTLPVCTYPVQAGMSQKNWWETEMFVWQSFHHEFALQCRTIKLFCPIQQFLHN